jgi:hypothetical protein
MMRSDPRRLDRVLGYLGLLLIGTLGWIADRIRVGPAAPEGATHPYTARATRRAQA